MISVSSSLELKGIRTYMDIPLHVAPYACLAKELHRWPTSNIYFFPLCAVTILILSMSDGLSVV